MAMLGPEHPCRRLETPVSASGRRVQAPGPGVQGGKVSKNETGTEIIYQGRTQRDRLPVQRRLMMRLMQSRGRTYKHDYWQGSHNCHPSCFRVICAVASYSGLGVQGRDNQGGAPADSVSRLKLLMSPPYQVINALQL